MGFSFQAPLFLLDFISYSDAGFMLIMACCFGIPIFSILVGLLLKPLKTYTKFCNIIILPLWLTWVLGSISAGVLVGIEIEVIKILTAIVLIYLLMVIYCIFNINLLTKYVNQYAKK